MYNNNLNVIYAYKINTFRKRLKSIKLLSCTIRDKIMIDFHLQFHSLTIVLTLVTSAVYKKNI